MITKYALRFGAAVALALAATTAHAEYKEAWRASGFLMPESVAYDRSSGAFFVSNINSSQFQANGEGYVFQIDAAGKVVKEKFVAGLNAPKGIDIAGNRLFVAGIEELVEVSLPSGEIVQRYKAPGATFLNDVSVAPDGRVFVSETMQSAIYVLENGSLKEWLKDPKLAGANGVYISGNSLFVALLGDLSQGFQNVKPSNVKVVDLGTRAITDFGSAEPVGVLDGLEPMPGGSSFVVTDNPGGRLIAVAPDGGQTVLAMPGPGAADHEIAADKKLVVIPMTRTSEVIGYTIE